MNSVKLGCRRSLRWFKRRAKAIIAKINETIMYYCLCAFAFVLLVSIAGANVVFYLTLLLFLLFSYYNRDRLLLLRKDIVYAFSGFIILLFILSFFSYDVTRSFERAVKFTIRFMPFVFILLFVTKREQLVQLLTILALSVLVIDCMAFWQFFNGSARPEAFSGHPIILGGILLQVIPVMLLMAINCPYLAKKHKIFFAVIAVISLCALLANATRGAWVALSVTLVVCMLLMRSKKSFGVIALLIIFSFSFYYVPSFHDRLLSIADLNNMSNSERILMWQSAWQMFLDHPLTGIGLHNFEQLEKTKYISPLAKEPGVHFHAHNNYLNFLAETGIIGFIYFIFLLGFILRLFFNYYKKHSSNWGLLGVLVALAFCIQGLTEYTFGHLQGMWLFWFLLGIFYKGILLESINGKSEATNEHT